MASDNVLITSAIADIQTQADAADLNLNLFNYFDDPRTTGMVATFQLNNTNLGNGGTTNVVLFDQAGEGSPSSVQNFLNYVNSGAYTNSFIHRSALTQVGGDFIIQGGGFTVDGFDASGFASIEAVSSNSPLVNDYSDNRPNRRGTLAFAKLGGNPDSATNQWFFNTADNTNVLGIGNNGGFSVFGEVASNADLATIDAIADLPRFNLSNVSSLPLSIRGALTETPFVTEETGGFAITDDDDFVRYESIIASQQQELSFQVLSNSNPGLVIPTIVDGQLTLDYQPNQSGSADIVIRATNLQGDFTDDSFSVVVSGSSTADKSDFNGDNKNDLLLYNPAQQWSGIAFMDGGNIIGSAALWTGWKPVGKGDFDRDGETEIVVQNTDNGWKGILNMSGSSIQSSQSITGWDDWDIVGVGNFSGDSTPDIVVRHQSQPWHGVLEMGGSEGSQVVRSQGFSMWAGWDIKAVADFNNDGKADLVAQHQTEDWFGILYLDDNQQIVQSQSIEGWADWNIVGSSDQNNDGRADLLIEHQSQPWNGVWFMEGNQIVGSQGQNIWAGWEVAA